MIYLEFKREFRLLDSQIMFDQLLDLGFKNIKTFFSGSSVTFGILLGELLELPDELYWDVWKQLDFYQLGLRLDTGKEQDSPIYVGTAPFSKNKLFGWDKKIYPYLEGNAEKPDTYRTWIKKKEPDGYKVSVGPVTTAENLLERLREMGFSGITGMDIVDDPDPWV